MAYDHEIPAAVLFAAVPFGMDHGNMLHVFEEKFK
jgi:hypothetical protein